MPDTTPSPEEIRAAVTRYVEMLSQGDAQGIIELYADDPRVEDPVGGDPIVGREAIRNFYAGMSGRLKVELTGPIRVAGLECAFPMLARLDLGGNPMEMDVIDVMQFDDVGKVTQLRAFWNPAEMRPAG